jgi:phenylacetate-coenzyme A ligase PaaK-like adenylate-forming protein
MAPPSLESKIDDKTQLITPTKEEKTVISKTQVSIEETPKSFEMTKNNFNPEQITDEASLEKIPFIHVSAMKKFLLLSKAENKAVLKLTSSGTRGSKTQIWFDKESLHKAQQMLEGVWRQEGLVSDVPTNYLNFIYNPKQSEDLGIAFSVNNEQRFAPIKNSYFAINKKDNVWFFDKEKVKETLLSYYQQESPIRLMGVPSFIYEFLEDFKPAKPLKAPANSYMVIGGGWKTKENKKVEKDYFREVVNKKLGIPKENIRDNYGMAEHGAPYKECSHHQFHIPVYCKIIVRDPYTLKALPEESSGLLELLTPYNTQMPNLAILSTDLGKIDKKACPCGKNSPTFRLEGRAGVTQYKGCAITANEIVQRIGHEK